MDALTLFGVVAVTSMLIFYAVEHRGPVFILCFAASCAASSAYGFLQGAWPFGIVEGIWTFVALQRWRQTATTAGPMAVAGVPIACDMTAFTPAERLRYDALRARVLGALSNATVTETGLRAHVAEPVPIAEVAEWLGLERRCCPFLEMTLTLGPGQPARIALQGGPGVREFLSAEFSAVPGLG